MGRATAGLVAGLVLLAGCASVSDADARACDYLFTQQDSDLDEDLPALEDVVEELGPVAEGGTLSADLQPFMQRVVSDAERLLDGRKARYLNSHVLDALSVCMDQGW
ncbi:hypothetical protein [Blastococcus sp. TF02A-26]|uniref:hypothetical protein n=1 Tax=Blastococcus sp. TF02A-26 TaxID=2250577 RepID=UPI000DE977E0|nr:hypothetical protein [Blastococcus sp. TF02A-26]RBY90592.1 hypothetical protein DQ240_00465 [Blastococcus sp. TF02A-26]